MKRLALTLPALRIMAKLPGGPTELRITRAKAQTHRDKAQKEHDARVAIIDGLIERIGIALGEISA